jgi:hypothetical protein
MMASLNFAGESLKSVTVTPRSTDAGETSRVFFMVQRRTSYDIPAPFSVSFVEIRGNHTWIGENFRRFFKSNTVMSFNVSLPLTIIPGEKQPARPIFDFLIVQPCPLPPQFSKTAEGCAQNLQYIIKRFLFIPHEANK